jgi:hypothetical protein
MAEKNVYEQLADLQNQLAEMQSKPRTVQDLIAEDDSKIIEFIKNARRVWRYSGDTSELKRENKRRRRKFIIGFFVLTILLIVPFFFITQPFGWILPIFSITVCIGQGIYQALIFKHREYEVPYDQIPSLGRYAELDDNDIVCATKDKWWVIALGIVLWLMPIALGAEMLIFLEGLWKIAGYVMIILCSVLWLPFKDNTIYGYQLHFVDDKNDIEYHLLKDFMKRNKLK